MSRARPRPQTGPRLPTLLFAITPLRVMIIWMFAPSISDLLLADRLHADRLQTPGLRAQGARMPASRVS